MYIYDIDISYNNNIEYQKSILKVFDMNDLNDSNRIIDELLLLVDGNDSWLEILNKVSEKHLLVKKRELGMSLLLSYDYLALFHESIKEYKKYKTTNSLQELLKLF